MLSDVTRLAVTSGLSEAPVVGGFLGGLVDLLWPPSAEDIWSAIQSQVEALIDQKLADQVKKDVSATLAGLKAVIQDYKTNVKGRPSDSVSAYDSAETQFDAAKPHFIGVPGSELLLLPLTAQLANMHLALLRDGVLFGAQWGLDNRWLKQKKAKLAAQIKEYVDFARTWFINGYISAGPLPQYHVKRMHPTRADQSYIPIDQGRYRARMWSFHNKYVREMTLSVLDYAFYWPSFDPDSAAARQLPPLTREIYSSAEGVPDSQHYIGAGTTPAQPISNVAAWEGTGISAVQVTYGKVQGPRMGRADGTVPAGWKGTVPANNPIVRVDGFAYITLNQLQLTFKDGTKTIAAAGKKSGHRFSWHFPGHMLSSISISGASDHAPAADCAIFGFRLRRDASEPAPQLDKSPMAGNYAAGFTVFDYYDQAMAVSKLWVNADGDKIRGLAWQYPCGNAIRVGDIPQNLDSFNPCIAFDAGKSIEALTLKDSSYGRGSVQRIEITTMDGKMWSAGVDGGHPTGIPALSTCIVGFYGAVNRDNFISSLGVYLRPEQST